MKRYLVVLALLFLSYSPPAHAAELWVATVSVTTSASTALNIGASEKVTIQCDNAAYLNVGTSTVAGSTTTGFLVPTGSSPWDTSTTRSLTYLSFITASGSASCRVFLVRR